MDAQSASSMGRYRALMTETDREYISGEGDPTDEQLDQAVYRVRQRIREELVQDMAILAENRPDILEELRDEVCEGIESND
jgi:1,6-anhydro-N-acetylmuramate kinase